MPGTGLLLPGTAIDLPGNCPALLALGPICPAIALYRRFDARQLPGVQIRLVAGHLVGVQLAVCRAFAGIWARERRGMHANQFRSEQA
jgi:hypothetical protein